LNFTGLVAAVVLGFEELLQQRAVVAVAVVAAEYQLENLEHLSLARQFL
jgi:hypothetical protein